MNLFKVNFDLCSLALKQIIKVIREVLLTNESSLQFDLFLIFFFPLLSNQYFFSGQDYNDIFMK